MCIVGNVMVSHESLITSNLNCFDELVIWIKTRICCFDEFANCSFTSNLLMYLVMGIFFWVIGFFLERRIFFSKIFSHIIAWLYK